MPYIRIGTDPYSGESVYFYERNAFGVNIVVAPTRYGKTALVKLLYVKIANLAHRPIIVIDYRSEHKESEWPNWDSKDSMYCIPFKTIENFGFRISDFDSHIDWQSLNFPPQTSMQFARLAKHKEAHQDDPELFKEMLADLPQYDNMMTKFEQRWGFALSRPVHKEVYKALQGFAEFEHIFCSEKSKLIEINNWQAMVWKHKHLHICLNIAREDDKLKARAYVGKILEKLSDASFLRIIRPVFVFEEADKLVPNVSAEDRNSPSSLLWVQEYVLKLQKYHPELFFITQDLHLLDSMVVSNFHTMILGGNQKYHPSTQYLRWDSSRNYREFLLINKGQRETKIFVPEDCPCKMVEL